MTEENKNKSCKKCNVDKTEDEYYVQKYKDQTKSLNTCKSCMNSIRKEKYQAKHTTNVPRNKVVNKNNFINKFNKEQVDDIRGKLNDPKIKKKYVAKEYNINYPSLMYYYQRHVKTNNTFDEITKDETNETN